jgi:hydrogenase maturation protein HypF
MTVVNRVPSGDSSVKTSASTGFDWMQAGLWDVPVEQPVPDREELLVDAAVCDACLREVFDPGNRRHRYPFTSCRNCGPRHSILRKMPYERAHTTMAEFTMCEECEREARDVRSRRHGHEANCCALCGPAFRVVGPAGESLGTTDPVVQAARALRAQLTIGLKGDGDYHLVCDATSGTAVARLRARAGMRDVPLTVLVRDLEEASRIARLTNKETTLLTSVERPVVLVSIRTDSPLAGEVAAGNQLAGLLLPYTPLHHLLLSETGRPLVFAPAGVRDSALLARNSAAIAALKHVADIFLLHDRAIAARDDDSVARVVDEHVSIEHRSRGIAPQPVRLSRLLSRPLVAMGAGVTRMAWFGSGANASTEPIVPGDNSGSDVIDRVLKRAHDMFGIDTRLVAIDSLEEGSFRAHSSGRTLEVVPVQHHHAHLVACMAENGLQGEVLAVVYDGGAPGISDLQWGGEIFRGGYTTCERVATFRPLSLPGARAVRRLVWPAALTLLDDAFDGEPPLHAINAFRNIPRRGVELVRRLRTRSACMTSGAQVYVDAIAALVLNRAETPLDGTLARELDAMADAAVTSRYPVVIRDGVAPWEIDLRSLARQATLDSIGGVAPSTIAARVRNTLVEVTCEILLAYGGGRHELPIVLSGDLFDRTALASPIRARLGANARVCTHAAVPAGDEGLGLGQVVIADALLHEKEHRSTSAIPARANG